MDNVYSKMYTGHTNTFGIGSGGSKHLKLKHSSSMPYFTNQSNNYPLTFSDQPPYKKINNNTNLSNNSNQKLRLPIIEAMPRRKRYITKSSEQSSYSYHSKNNRNELSNFMIDINKNISSRLQNDNFIAQQKLNNIKNNYNEIKTLLNNKIEKLEQDQQMQFENLKYALEQGGGLKMMGAVKNANGGNIYDLKRAEEEDIIDATRKLPRLLEEKINIINNMKIKEKEDEKRLLSQVKRKVNEEIKKQKEKDEIRFKRELDDIEQKRENIRQERRRLIEELQNRDIEESEIESLNSQPIYNQNIAPQSPFPPSIYPTQMPQMMTPYAFPPNIYPPMNNNNNKDSTDELLKIFILKKIFDDKPQTVQTAPQIQPIPQYIPNPYPPPQYPPYQPPPQYQQPQPQQQPITIPQPIIIQSPQSMAPPPNVIIHEDRAQPQIQPQIIQPQLQYRDLLISNNDTLNSRKRYQFIDPLDEYLKETRSTKKKSYSKVNKKSSSRKKTTIKESKENEEESASKQKLDDKKNSKNKEKISKKESKSKDTKKKDSQKKDSKATKKSNKSKSKKKTLTKKPSKPDKKKKKAKEEEEEEDDEEEEEEEDDEEEEGEEDDDEGEELEDDANERIIRKKKK